MGCVTGCSCVMARLCMLEGSVQELTLPCHHVDPVAQTQVVRHLYPLNHLFSPTLTNLKQYIIYVIYVERNITHTHTWTEKVGSPRLVSNSQCVSGFQS